MIETLPIALAPDPALPARDALLDEGLMGEPLRRLGADGDADISRCTLVRVNYQVGKSLRALFRIAVAGTEHIVAVRMVRTGRSADLYVQAAKCERPSARLRGIVHLPELECVAWVFPNDRKIATLTPLLEGSAPMACGPMVLRRQVRVAAYAPEKSATLAYVDDAGVALFNTANASDFVANNLLNAVSFSAQLPALFKEGTALMSTASANGEYSFVRKLNTGRPATTGDNSMDFVFVSTDGGLYGGAQSTLGAPGPENSQSPVALNVSEFAAGPVDPAVCAACGVNRERSLVSDPMHNSTFGTLIIRRTFTNNTGRELTRLRFRIVDLTTYPAVLPALADMRVLTSSDSLVTVTGGNTVLVQGTVLENPPSQSHGGGLNSSLALPGIAPSLQRGGVRLSGVPSKGVKSGGAITLAAPLAPGQSVSVQILLGVQQPGSFRFFVNVEALP